MGLLIALAAGLGALALIAAGSARASVPGEPAGRCAALADELIEHGAAPGVDVVRLAQGSDRALYRAETDGAVLDLATNVEPALVEGVAREIATRLKRSAVPQRLVASTEAGDVELAVEFRRGRLGTTVSLRRVA